MRRGEVGNTVVYVKRYRKLSLAFFAAAVVAGGAAFLVPDKELGYQMLPYGGLFFLISLCFPHYSQSFIIDEPSILFLGNLGHQRQLQDLVVHLREDLRCPGTRASL